MNLSYYKSYLSTSHTLGIYIKGGVNGEEDHDGAAKLDGEQISAVEASKVVSAQGVTDAGGDEDTKAGVKQEEGEDGDGVSRGEEEEEQSNVGWIRGDGNVKIEDESGRMWANLGEKGSIFTSQWI